METPDALLSSVVAAGPSRRWHEVQAEAAGYSTGTETGTGEDTGEAKEAPSALRADEMW